MLKILNVLWLISLLALAGCFPTSTISTIEEDIIDVKNTSWELISPKDLKGTLHINEQGNKVSGNNGCNQYSAEVEQKNYVFQLNKFVTTERFCENWQTEEQRFMFLLSQARRFDVTKKRLNLRDETGVILTFKPLLKE